LVVPTGIEPVFPT